MTKIEDLKNAPFESTATNKVTGSRAVKIVDDCWLLSNGFYVDDEEMENYTLDSPAPTTAREALDLAWELAHEVREGQIIPECTPYLMKDASGLREYTQRHDFKIIPELVPIVRTLEPLPDPEPDWPDAPAVLARLKTWIPSATPRVFARYEHDHGYWLAMEPPAHHWSELTDVTPLYPEGDE